MVNSIRDNIMEIKAQIAAAAEKSGRGTHEIKLMGVSKYHPLEMMIEASPYVDILGENKVQEAHEKRLGWPVDNKRAWHLIGHLQRNKARKALEVFDLIESVDNLDLARILDRILAESDTAAYPIYIEVNMSGELTKNGVEPCEAESLAERVIEYCPRLSVEGLMTIGPNTDDEAAIRESFVNLRELRDTMRIKTGLSLPELSMGMSGDYKTAIEEGSTIVRIGTSIFGTRIYK